MNSGRFTPTDTVKLRASAARAIRTPNIADLFGGRGETFSGVADPCDAITASSTGNVAANCLSIAEVANRVAAEGAFNLTTIERQSTGGYIGGNEDVKEETSDSFSVGAIWQVTDEFSLTLDYYDIAVDDAIATTARTTVLNRCYGVDPSDFDATCGGAIRDTRGALTEVSSGTSNENDLSTKGLDIELSYKQEFAFGQLSADLIWNHLYEYVETSIESGEEIDYRGEVLTPTNRANLNLGYTVDDFAVSWRMKYWASSNDSNIEGNQNFSTGAPLDKFNRFPTVIYHDLSGTYNITAGTDVTLSVRNVFDKQPPVANQSSVSGASGINTVGEAYDVTGRYFQLSFTTKF
ncbi:TonB-dependent receptor [Pseudoalteromonas sp. AC71-MNA-CIBAN-0107]|uniref:TonB-dependent receptor domain-containing protein n=1 Tax=Pseudoalteromonas sp. AC71-MNA-CIBAN-0107 TaxID=3140437 RepID=UPI00332AA420